MAKSKVQQLTNYMRAKVPWAFAILLISFMVASCSDSAISPNPSNPDSNPTPGGQIVSGFQSVEITIKGMGEGQMTASAKFVNGQTGPNVAADITSPSDGSGTHGQNAKGTIQMKPISYGNFTVGKRSGDGWRYTYAVFKIRNADTNGVAYQDPLKNLTFIATDNNNTFGQTAIAYLARFNGNNPYTGAKANSIAKNIKPTGQVTLSRTNQLIPTASDVMQVYTETKLGGLNIANGSLIPYGFTTINKKTGGRVLPANPSNNQYDGVVVFAFKVPLQSQVADDPFVITGIFTPVEQTKTRITQSLEEQTEKGRKKLTQHIKEVGINNIDNIIVFPGSKFWKYENNTTLRCTNVRVAGQPNNATTKLLSSAAMNRVSIESGVVATIGDQITIHGCDLSNATVTVGGQTATIVSGQSDNKHLVVEVPSGITTGKDHEIVVDHGGNTYTAGTVHLSDAFIGPNVSVYANSGILSSVENKNNIIDNNTSNYADLSITLGALGTGSAHIGVKYTGSNSVATGSRAGFVVEKGDGLLGASLLGNITITTYLDGQVQEQKSGSGVLNLNILGGTQKAFVGFTTSKKFDEIRFGVGGALEVATDFKVYGAYGDY